MFVRSTLTVPLKQIDKRGLRTAIIYKIDKTSDLLAVHCGKPSVDAPYWDWGAYSSGLGLISGQKK